MRTRLLIGRARENRSTLTKEERILWYHLRYSQLGVRFRRQHPIGHYIVDFACISHRLVVEADGGQHADSLYDRIRDRFLRQEGWTVLRFWNLDILNNLEGVLGTIVGALEQAERPNVPQRIAKRPHGVPLRKRGDRPTAVRARGEQSPTRPRVPPLDGLTAIGPPVNGGTPNKAERPPERSEDEGTPDT